MTPQRPHDDTAQRTRFYYSVMSKLELLKFWTFYYSRVQIETMEVLNIILLLSQVAERDSELDPVITALQSCRWCRTVMEAACMERDSELDPVIQLSHKMSLNSLIVTNIHISTIVNCVFRLWFTAVILALESVWMDFLEGNNMG